MSLLQITSSKGKNAALLESLIHLQATISDQYHNIYSIGCINKGDNFNYKFVFPNFNALLTRKPPIIIDSPNNNPEVDAGNSLQFKSNTELIYINENDAKVHELIYETAYGINAVLTNYPY